MSSSYPYQEEDTRGRGESKIKRILEGLLKGVQSPYEKVTRWKQETGRKVIGCLPMYVPEEIIHAAGMLPITILGRDEPVSLIDEHLQPSLCHPVRSTFELALKGSLNFLNGIVFPDICDSVTCISDIWLQHQPLPFHHSIMLPGRLDLTVSKEYLVKEYMRLKTHLEEFSGTAISENALRKSINIYNHNRSLLTKLYDLRQKFPSLFHSRDMVTLTIVSMYMLKEEHSAILSQLLEKITQTRQQTDNRIRLFYSGCFCDGPEPWFLDMIEEMGAVVVDDDLYTGRRYFTTQVNELINPIEALAERYIKDIPCPTKYNPANNWADYLINIVNRSQARGVIIEMLKYCEPHGFDYPFIKNRLSEAAIPHLFLETDHPSPRGAIRTRLQAFIETLER